MKIVRKSLYAGLDYIHKKWPKQLKGARVGLLVHPASVNSRWSHATDILLKSRNLQLTALFGPQHGMFGETQDNMVEWEGFRDKRTGLPVYSLYGNTRKPSSQMLKNIDVMVTDLQDVGSRYYTFIWTMELCMQACTELDKQMVILDRPNPIGGNLLEGPVLDTHYASFVGQRPLPVRHGMTIGEIALYLRQMYYPSLDLHVIPVIGWKREMWFDETGLPWVMPSPNMATPDTATVYPGMCLLEGTNLSEGRGTTRPFELFGAPFINAYTFVQHIEKCNLSGVVFRPLHFKPTFQKYAEQICGGAQIHVTDREKFRPFKTAVAILTVISKIYPSDFTWKSPPYEYEYKKLPIDMLAGTDRLRKDIEHGEKLKHMEEWWTEQYTQFNKKIRRHFLLYT